jgi:flavorubredoxin
VLNDFLAAAPRTESVCGQIAAMVSVNNYADRPPRALADGATLKLGRHALRWCDAPHLPHAWECGFMMETTTSTLLCGDLFTQGGKDHPALTPADILGPSEAFRAPMDYYAHAPNSRELLSRLAAFRPTTLACMHGSAWHGDGARLLLALADRIAAGKERPAGSAEDDEFVGSLTDPKRRHGSEAHGGERAERAISASNDRSTAAAKNRKMVS